MRIFFGPNANIMPINFAIRMKCGLITEHKTFIELVFFKFLLHINTELFTLSLVICSYGLNKLQFVGFCYQMFPYYPPNCRWRYQGSIFVLLMDFLQECLTNLQSSLLLLLVIQILLLCKESLRLRISFSSSKFALLLVISSRTFSQTHTAQVLFEFVRAYSNT